MAHFSMYDMLLVGAERPFMFRVAMFMFALILSFLWFGLWVVCVSLCVSRWCTLAFASLVLGCVTCSGEAGGLRGRVWGILRCGDSRLFRLCLIGFGWVYWRIYSYSYFNDGILHLI